ncbi:hypothetical protein OUZ56_008239 [Daphnia magna]|uniref:Uncharacterized protein n=1 Tax=Daphnia magna TaxID=35525 RepID=A0ABR0ACD5_9CRUS|nr:hypothetical protein OUZ56_008239 [Daphnia magna]
MKMGCPSGRREMERKSQGFPSLPLMAKGAPAYSATPSYLFYVCIIYKFAFKEEKCQWDDEVPIVK